MVFGPVVSLLLAFPLLVRAQFGHLPSGSFCGSVESGEGNLDLNLTFASPCRLSLTGAAAWGSCNGEDYTFDSDACFSRSPSWLNCTVDLPNLKNGSDCFKRQGIRQITYDMCTNNCTGPPRLHIYAFTDTAYRATLKPCGVSPDRYLIPEPNGTTRPLRGPVQCGIAEQKLCGTAQPKGTQVCMACAGAHAVELVEAGCSDGDIRDFCGSGPAPQPHQVRLCAHCMTARGLASIATVMPCPRASYYLMTHPVPRGVCARRRAAMASPAARTPVAPSARTVATTSRPAAGASAATGRSRPQVGMHD